MRARRTLSPGQEGHRSSCPSMVLSWCVFITVKIPNAARDSPASDALSNKPCGRRAHENGWCNLLGVRLGANEVALQRQVKHAGRPVEPRSPCLGDAV